MGHTHGKQVMRSNGIFFLHSIRFSEIMQSTQHTFAHYDYENG